MTQASAHEFAQLLKHAGDAIVSNSAQLDAARARITQLEDENDSLRHDFSNVSARNRRLVAEVDQLRRYVAEDAETIKSLQSQLTSVANDSGRSYALIANLKRDIANFENGADPRQRTHLPDPNELFDRFLEIGDLIGLDRERLLASLAPPAEEPTQERVEPTPPKRRSAFSRLFGRGDYLETMTRREPEAVRPKMMQSVAEDIAASPLAVGKA